MRPHPSPWAVVSGLILIAALVLAAPVARAAPAGPAERYVAVCPGAGSSLDCVHVLQIGRAPARRVLVLEGGDGEGAAMLRPAARHLSRTVPDTQVWAVERREQNLHDDTAPARGWGLAVTLADLRRVVALASDHGRRKVILGGHSWGATIALAYAAWDFDGRAGYRDLAGLVLIDGGAHDSFAGEGYRYRLGPDDVNRRLERIAAGEPCAADWGLLWGLHAGPRTAPAAYREAARRALEDPGGSAPLQQDWPAPMRPGERLTNAALLGWLTDAHAPKDDLRVRSGRLGDSGGSVRGWVETGPAPILEVARAFAAEDPAGVETCWPRRLSLDLEALDPFRPTPASDRLGLSLAYAAEIDTPLYVFQTGLTHGSVEQAGRWVAANSRIRTAVYVTDARMTHLDPLLAAPGRNRFLETVGAFLEEI